ncbi:hypothetical protein ACLB2K_049507 [Fragaria x ananassa]
MKKNSSPKFHIFHFSTSSYFCSEFVNTQKTKMRWERVHLQPPHQAQHHPQGVSLQNGIYGPGKRWGHTCNAIKEGRLLYVFGGYGRDNCQTHQVHVFDTVTHTWSQPVIIGTPPTPRDSHSCTTVGENLFVFGGTDGTNPLKDLHILDTSSHTWISPTLKGEGPEAREGHSAALVGKRLFVFGGCGKSANNNEEVYYNDLYILNTETFAWKKAITSGQPPSPRDSHTCSSSRNTVIVIGGEDGHDYYLSDVHILDADTLVWRELNTSGQLLPPRGGHSTVAFGKNLFVFGGFTDARSLYNDLYMLDVDTGLWTRVITTGDGPSARFSVAGDCLDPAKGGVLVFIGGCNKSLEGLDDMYYLNTGLVRESERRLEKLSLRKQLKLKCQEQNLTPIHDRALVPVGTGADIFQHGTIPFYGQPGEQVIPLNQSTLAKRSFQAKVTERLFDGYTIETVIDGKPLRGVLFPNKSELRIPVAPNSSRKRGASEVDGIMSNGGCNSKSTDSKGIGQEAIHLRQPVKAQAQESTSQEIASGQVSSNPVQLVNPSNLGDALKSNTEGLGNDRTEITTGGNSAAIS